jgi:hypothetical protein
VATALDEPAELALARKGFEAMSRKGPREYSWFIYRATNPTIRDMFMHPGNPFRVKEGLMSLLAGDIYSGKPMWRALGMFKFLYYVISITHIRRSWRGWKRHRFNVRDMGMLKGETVQKSE